MVLLNITVFPFTSFVELIKVFLVELLADIDSEHLVVEYMAQIVEVQGSQLLKDDPLEVLLHHFVFKNNVSYNSFLTEFEQHFDQLARVLEVLDVLNDVVLHANIQVPGLFAKAHHVADVYSHFSPLLLTVILVELVDQLGVLNVKVELQRLSDHVDVHRLF